MMDTGLGMGVGVDVGVDTGAGLVGFISESGLRESDESSLKIEGSGVVSRWV